MTALEAARLGVSFKSTPAGLRMFAPPGSDAVVAQVRTEIANRVEMFRRYGEPRSPHSGRTGTCQVCGDPMPRFVGGDCSFCVAGRQKARQ